jgi:hypothetical protein
VSDQKTGLLVPESLPGSTWRYFHKNTPDTANNLMLLENGHIGLYVHRNEAKWAVVDGSLCFFDADDRLSVRFDAAATEAGSERLEGDYDPNPAIRLCLERVSVRPGYYGEPQSLLQLAQTYHEIQPSLTVWLPNALAMTNLDDLNPSFAAHMHKDIYVERSAQVDAIGLVELAETTVYGGGHFVCSSEGSLIAEQYPPYIGTIVPDLSTITGIDRPMQKFDVEAVLVARYGISTWGHWVAELLPKVALIEDAFPGRFRFVLPEKVVLDSGAGSIWTRIAESLVACGIPVSRVLPLKDEFDYSFTSMFAVTPVFSNHILHPAAGESLRRRTSAIHPSPAPKVAIVRDKRAGRQMCNAAEVYDILAASGFERLETGIMTFEEQVSVFKGASAIFGILGSDLSNLIFAPEGVKVIAAAPAEFGDRFFYALTLDRKGSFSDLRGPAVEPHSVIHKVTFSLDIGVLGIALATILPAKKKERSRWSPPWRRR